MKPNTINANVLQKLGFPHPMDYDVKPDGALAVIDANGQKFVIPFKDYSALLSESNATTPAKKGRRPESKRAQLVLDHAQHTGAELTSDHALRKGEEPTAQT